MTRTKFYIGTSGYSFNWEQYVAEKLTKTHKLRNYSRYFNSVEVNYSFYRLPRASTVKKWAEETADDFTFSMKFSRYITHIKRLKQVKTASKDYLDKYRHLGKKGGPILIQLPPNLQCDAGLLSDFLQVMKEAGTDMAMPSLDLAFEFRHPSWFDKEKETLKALAQYDACWVFGHSSKYPWPEGEPLGSDKFVYFRMHGPGKLFASEYGEERLVEWSEKFRKYKEQRDVYVYFNNDTHGYAAKDAFKLKEILGV